ncbi:hypothetical protein [Nocardioides speluncae]|uniref:hypothetical protein n=1 Tax=Nocardioides speluncae TaxID=2670337 RepID=UPI0012B179AE|nr:hypothetical protein [Nocardioides speluncae]
MRAAVVPMAPLLLPGESGLVDPMTDLRKTAVETVADLAEGLDALAVLVPSGIVGAPEDYRRPSGRAGSGPLAAQVATELLALAEVAVPTEIVPITEPSTGPPLTCLEGHGLLVLGDGTACRGQAAPGHLDERSFAFDDRLAEALAAGDGTALAGLDQQLAAELMVTGRHTFAALGRAIPKASRAELRYRDDPFGLTYFVALWRSSE